MNAAELAAAAYRVAEAAPMGAPSSALNGYAIAGAGQYVGAIRLADNNRERLRGASFDTRAEARAHAADMIARRRARLAADLCRPELRELRASYGLPRDIEPDA
jgi:hypothetical protein